jgi:hypothetical protein
VTFWLMLKPFSQPWMFSWRAVMLASLIAVPLVF